MKLNCLELIIHSQRGLLPPAQSPIFFDYCRYLRAWIILLAKTRNDFDDQSLQNEVDRQFSDNRTIIWLQLHQLSPYCLWRHCVVHEPVVELLKFSSRQRKLRELYAATRLDLTYLASLLLGVATFGHVRPKRSLAIVTFSAYFTSEGPMGKKHDLNF